MKRRLPRPALTVVSLDLTVDKHRHLVLGSLVIVDVETGVLPAIQEGIVPVVFGVAGGQGAVDAVKVVVAAGLAGDQKDRIIAVFILVVVR